MTIMNRIVTLSVTAPESPLGLQGPATSITYRGVTFSFSNPVQWYESANGDPVVISHADHLPNGTSITSISPAGAVSAENGYDYNGTVKNPVETVPLSIGQGFDEGLAHTPWATEKQHEYVDALNIDPGKTGEAITINAGDAFTIVKAVRAADALDGDAKPIEKYVPLTIMDSLPPGPGTYFRPAISTEVKEWPARPLEEMDFSGGANSPLRNLPQPTGLEMPSVYLARIEEWDTKTQPLWSTTSEEGRRAYLRKELGSDGVGYSRDAGRERGEYALSLFIDQTENPTEQAAREQLAAILIQWGIDRDGAHQMGNIGGAGAGQWYGFIEFFYLAGFMLSDAAMLERAQWHRSNTFQQIFWVNEELIGYPTDWDPGTAGGNLKRVGETYQRGMLHIPDWTKGAWMSPEDVAAKTLPAQVTNLGATNASLLSSYRDVSFNTVILEAFPIFLLRNGPSGETGIEAANHNLPVGVDNIASAVLPYIDRTMPFTSPANLSRHTGVAVEAYDLWRDEIPQARWTGQPDTISDHDWPLFSLSGVGDGEIELSLTAVDYSTKPITERQISYSQDGLQFVDAISMGTNTTYTLTGLREGTPHWCRWRQINEDDEASIWSQTWEQNLAAGSADAIYKTDRGKLSTTGTPSGTLTNEVAPAIVHKPYPGHPMPYFEPVGEVAPLTLYAGMGYWTGGTGDLTAAYQWQRDTGSGFADIADATDAEYTRTAEDSSHTLRCKVTITDGAAASVEAISNEVAIPAARQYPVGVLVDTDFGPGWAVDWPDLASGTVAAAGDLLHLPTYVLEGQDPGILVVDKSDTQPRFDIPLGDAVPGTYVWSAEVLVGVHENDTANADTWFRIRNADDTWPWDSAEIWASEDIDTINQPKIVPLSGQFTLEAGDAGKPLIAHCRVATQIGEGEGGDPGLASLMIYATTTAPGQFQPGDWSLDANGGVTIERLPFEYGAAIEDIEYRVDGGSWSSSGGIVGFTIPGISGGESIEIRAVSANGEGPESVAKTVPA